MNTCNVVGTQLGSSEYTGEYVMFIKPDGKVYCGTTKDLKEAKIKKPTQNVYMKHKFISSCDNALTFFTSNRNETTFELSNDVLSKIKVVLNEKIGDGSDGMMYKFEFAPDLHCFVTVKVFTNATTFHKELDALKKIGTLLNNIDDVQKMYFVVPENNQVVYNYIEGTSLHEYINTSLSHDVLHAEIQIDDHSTDLGKKRKRAYELSDKKDTIVYTLVQTLKKMHDVGVYHGNIRPETLVYDVANERIVITSFQHAQTEKITTECPNEDDDYFPPEFNDKSMLMTYNIEKYDIFALGISLIEFFLQRRLIVQSQQPARSILDVLFMRPYKSSPVSIEKPRFKSDVSHHFAATNLRLLRSKNIISDVIYNIILPMIEFNADDRKIIV